MDFKTRRRSFPHKSKSGSLIGSVMQVRQSSKPGALSVRSGCRRCVRVHPVPPSCAYIVQMAGTAEIVTSMEKLPGVTYQVLVPNEKGLENVVSLLAAHPGKPPIDEIAVFTAATDAFSLANTNVTVAESLKRLARVVQGALDKGIRVRGYVSVVIACPYSGKVDYNNVRDVTKELLDMGCYEVSLGDTTGMGNPTSVDEMLNVTLGTNPVEKLAGHVRSTPPRVILPSHHLLF